MKRLSRASALAVLNNLRTALANVERSIRYIAEEDGDGLVCPRLVGIDPAIRECRDQVESAISDICDAEAESEVAK